MRHDRRLQLRCEGPDTTLQRVLVVVVQIPVLVGEDRLAAAARRVPPCRRPDSSDQRLRIILVTRSRTGRSNPLQSQEAGRSSGESAVLFSNEKSKIDGRPLGDAVSWPTPAAFELMGAALRSPGLELQPPPHPTRPRPEKARARVRAHLRAGTCGTRPSTGAGSARSGFGRTGRTPGPLTPESTSSPRSTTATSGRSRRRRTTPTTRSRRPTLTRSWPSRAAPSSPTGC